MLRYKACKNSIVTLELSNDSKTNEKRKDVVDNRYAKFRCDKAKVIDITNVTTGEKMEKDVSIRNKEFIYNLNKKVTTGFNIYLNIVCTWGIHYFKTKKAAVSWFYTRLGDKNFPDGKWETWHENGQTHYEGTWKNGVENGKFMYWYENGNQQHDGTFKDGKLDGKWVEWCKNAKKKSEITYKDGKIITSKYY